MRALNQARAQVAWSSGAVLRLEAELAAARLAHQQASETLAAAERATRLQRVPAGAASVASAPPPPGATRPPDVSWPPDAPGRPDAPRPRRSVPVAAVLLVVGAVLVLSAAVVFVSLTWRDLGVVGQAVVLATVTAAAATGTTLARRARLPAATEVLAAVTAGLVVVDLVGARTFDLFGLGSVRADAYVLACAVLVLALALVVVAGTTPGARPGAAPPPPRLRSAVVVACAAVGVGAFAAAVWCYRVVPGQWATAGSGAVTRFLEGLVEAPLLSGLGCLCLAVLTRRVRGAGAVVRTALAVGWALLGTLGALTAVVALVAPFENGPVDRWGLARLTVVGVVAVALALSRTTTPPAPARAVAAATGAWVLTGTAVTLLRGASVADEVAVLLPVLLLAVVVRAPYRAQPLRWGVTVALLVLGAGGLLAVAGGWAATVELLHDPAPAPSWWDLARWPVVGLLVLLSGLWSVSPTRAVAAHRVVAGVRADLAVGAAAAVVVVLCWALVTGLSGPPSSQPPWLLVTAVLSLLAVTAASAASGRSRLRTGRWLLPGGVAAGCAAALVAALVAVAGLDRSAGTHGAWLGGYLLACGAGTVVVAAAGTRGWPGRIPGDTWWRDRRTLAAQLSRSGVVVVGVVVATVGAGLLVPAVASVWTGAVDGALAALLLCAVASLALLLTPAWPAARAGVALLGLPVSLEAAAAVDSTGWAERAVWPAWLAPTGSAWTVGAVGVLVLALAATRPVAGWYPLRPYAVRHVVLPGLWAAVAVSGLAAVRGLLDRTRLDVSALPATVVLLVATLYLLWLLGRPVGAVGHLDGTVRTLLRDGAVTLLTGAVLATLVVAGEPVLALLPLTTAALPWLVLAGATVVAGLLVLGVGAQGVRDADPALADYTHLVRDLVLPLASAATALLLLVTLRPLTGLPIEVEGLVVAVASLLAHLLRVASDRAHGRAGGRVTLRDLVAAGSGLALGSAGVLAALAGERPLWVSGLTWLVTGAWGLGTAALLRGPLAGPWPGAVEARGWWAVRLGAASALVGYLLAVVELDTTVLERFTVPLGLVLVAFGLWALLSRPRPTEEPLGSVRCLLPGLVVALGPSTVHAVLAPDGVRPVVVALVATALVIGGALLRWQAPLLVGLVAVLPVAVVQALPLVTALPQWVYLAAAGVLALVLGVTFERQRQRALEAGRRWRELR